MQISISSCLGRSWNGSQICLYMKYFDAIYSEPLGLKCTYLPVHENDFVPNTCYKDDIRTLNKLSSYSKLQASMSLPWEQYKELFTKKRKAFCTLFLCIVLAMYLWLAADMCSPHCAYSVAAEPQFRSGVSHQSGTTEPSFRLFEPLTI